MKSIKELRKEIKLNEENLASRRRMFMAECDKELEMLIKMKRWLDMIEDEAKKVRHE